MILYLVCLLGLYCRLSGSSDIKLFIMLPMKIKMNIRDMDAEFELEAMAEPDENGELCLLVVECEPIEVPDS